ncbi:MULTISPECIES: WD40/YVTN/BNR-like repeat-containing protein [Oceanospirillaceae]|uniref:YCF48-related protein n=1 Tax=Oceanobacter antarcticus TaxID=3133425 RepID=A0ABW8NM59_9GAMM|tara:strand:+ start:9913 stop:11034 length:1122 start_codon:yes stop_codon:yes gene_type:complete
MSIATLFKSPLLSGVGLMLGAGLVIASVASQSPVDALREADTRPALEAAHASHAAMLAVAQAGQRLVSVGEHGLILFSEDQGQTWQQAKVPVSVTLTAVSFANALQGWAAGHYGLILHTEDGGQSWTVQMDGQRAANLVLKEAEVRAEGTDDRQLKRALFSAKRLVADGPDKPFLDIHFRNAREGLAVGAYGLILATVDGGNRWMPLNYNMANSGERHLYSIAEANGYLYIAGEEGLLFRSQPGNDWHFDRLKTPYDGSFFTLSAAGEQLVAAGLKGNAFRSLDGGDSWQTLDLPSDASVVDSILGANGDLLLVNQAGQLLQGNVATAAVRVLPSQPVAAPTAVLRTGQNSLLLSGLRGLAQVLVPSVQVLSN